MIKWTPQKLGIRLHCCVCQISTDKQSEGLTIQREGGVGGGVLVSVVVNGGTGPQRRENNSCGQDGIVSEKSGRRFTSLTFSESGHILDTLPRRPLTSKHTTPPTTQRPIRATKHGGEGSVQIKHKEPRDSGGGSV